MKPLLTLAVLAALAAPAHAHRFWIVPSATVLSGDEPWVTFDAAVSNNLFFPDHVAPPIEAFTGTGPDGKPVELLNGSKGRYRTVFDLKLDQEGTYRVGTIRETVGAAWEENGEPKNFRGSHADFKAAGLEGKPGITVSESYSRVETYVTKGEPTAEALAPSGKGLEVIFDETHPNDLFAGEAASFTLHMNGKPAAGVKVAVIKGDDRYRSEQGEITATTDDKGRFQVTWPEAGRYWVNAAVSGNNGPAGTPPASAPVTTGEKAKAPEAGKGGPQGVPGGGGGRGGNRSVYTGVFEVLPE